MSKCIRKWKIGDEIYWRGPFGEFKYQPNSFKQVIMLIAGSGITPVVEIIQQILDDENEETLLCLLYACCCYDEILLKTKLKSWESFWNFSVIYCLSQEKDKTKKQYGDKIHYGRINQELLSKEIRFNVNNIFVIICGPTSFNKDMRSLVNLMEIHNCFIF